jgi:hypothetical protein
MRPILILFPCITSIACGGRLAITDEAPSPASSNVEQEPVASSDSPAAEDGAWGTWQLLWIKGADGQRDDSPPFLQLDLHPEGSAYLWQCTSPTQNMGKRCDFSARSACRVGTISLSGTTWGVRFAAGDGELDGFAAVVEEASGDITVDGTGILPARGHYRRVAAPSHDACLVR